jgi:hypothetical protein
VIASPVMTLLIIALGVATGSLVVVIVMALRQRLHYRALMADLLRPEPVEAEPVPLQPSRPTNEELVLIAAQRYAERRAWQVAIEVAKVREREEAERELMAVAQQHAERRAWQVAMQMAKDRCRS